MLQLRGLGSRVAPCSHQAILRLLAFALWWLPRVWTSLWPTCSWLGTGLVTTRVSTPPDKESDVALARVQGGLPWCQT